MRIELHRNYRGMLTNEKLLIEGVHEVSNELGTYLVANGHASVVSEDIPLTELPDNTPPVEDVSFHNAIMQATGRPPIKLSRVDETEIVKNDLGFEKTMTYKLEFDRDYYLALYEGIYGRSAPNNIGDDTLKDKVENPPYDDTPDTDD